MMRMASPLGTGRDANIRARNSEYGRQIAPLKSPNTGINFEPGSFCYDPTRVCLDQITLARSLDSEFTQASQILPRLSNTLQVPSAPAPVPHPGLSPCTHSIYAPFHPPMVTTRGPLGRAAPARTQVYPLHVPPPGTPPPPPLEHAPRGEQHRPLAYRLDMNHYPDSDSGPLHLRSRDTPLHRAPKSGTEGTRDTPQHLSGPRDNNSHAPPPPTSSYTPQTSEQLLPPSHWVRTYHY